MGAMWLVGEGISLVGKLIDDAIETEKERIERLKELADKAQEAKSNIESITSEMKSNIDTVDNIKDRYAELAQGVDMLSNKNISLSTSEYEEFLDLTNQLSEVFPQLNMGIDDNGNAILDLNGDVNTITSSLQTLLDVEKQLAQQEIADNAGEYIANTLPQLKASYEDLEEQRKQFERDKARYSSVLDINSIGYGSGTNTVDVDKNISSMGADGIKSVLSEMGINKGWEAVYSNDKYHSLLGYKMELSTEDKNAIEKFYGSFVVETERNIKKSEAELARANKELSLMANYWLDNELSVEGLDGKAIYGNLQSDELQAGIKQMLNNVDWASLQITEGWDSEDDVYNYITENILSPLESVEPEIRDSIYNNVIKAFTDTTISSNDRLQILKDLQAQFDALGIEIDLSFKINEIESKNDIIRNQLGFNQNASNVTDARHNQEINSFINSLSDEEKTIWLESDIDEDTLNGTRKDWEDFLKELQKEVSVEVDVNPVTSLSDMDDAFSGFESIYEDIHNGTSVTASSIESLNEAFASIDGGTALQEFRDVLTTMPDDIDAQQEALNKLATAYLDNSDLLKNLTEDNAEYTASELRKIGVVNADEVVSSRLAGKMDYLGQAEQEYANLMANSAYQIDTASTAKRNAYLASIDLQNATLDQIGALISEANAAGQSSAALVNYARQLIASGRVSITTDGSIANLVALAKQLGDTGYVAELYARLQQAISQGAPSAMVSAIEAQIRSATYSLSYHSGKNANTVIAYSPPSSSSSSGGGGGSSSSENETSETFDWVETKITCLEEAIGRLDKIVNNTYDNWANRNKSLSSEISKVKEEINLQQQAYNRYMQEANSVGLSSTYVKKIQNGELDIETITDEGLREKIQNYQTWYEKAIQCSDAIQDLNITLGDLAQLQFDNISQEYSDLISLIEGSADLVDERINRTEEQGYFASSSYYKQMLNYEAQEMAKLKEEYNKLIKQRDSAVSSGAIAKDSEAYQAMTQEIQGVQQAIEESATATVELNNAIRDLNWEIFDYIEERISKITEESNFLIDLLDNQSLYNDNGSFNDRGESAAYLHGQNAEIYAQQVKDYAEEIKKINADLANDPSNKDLIERREELLDLQQESISNIYAEKEAVKSLVEEGINLHLSKLTELIDKYKESMNSAKDLYEYQKNISEQTEEISRLQKILKSYEGDDSEEARKSIQDYQNQLKDAETNLKETEWDKYISETDELLTNLYDEYSETLNARLDNIDALFADVINDTNANATSINATINSVAKEVGYSITMLNQTAQQIKNSIQQKTTSTISLKGYASGSHSIPYNQLAIVGEEGQELRYSTKRGTLEVLGQGDLVFTKDMTENLWQMAQGNMPNIISYPKLPNIVPNGIKSVNNQNTISINLPNVTNYDQFKNALQKDSKFVGFVQEVTLGASLGRNSLHKNKYK